MRDDGRGGVRSDGRSEDGFREPLLEDAIELEGANSRQQHRVAVVAIAGEADLVGELVLLLRRDLDAVPEVEAGAGEVEEHPTAVRAEQHAVRISELGTGDEARCVRTVAPFALRAKEDDAGEQQDQFAQDPLAEIVPAAPPREDEVRGHQAGVLGETEVCLQHSRERHRSALVFAVVRLQFLEQLVGQLVARLGKLRVQHRNLSFLGFGGIA